MCWAEGCRVAAGGFSGGGRFGGGARRLGGAEE
jgi:hypothetical protein